MLQKNKNVLLSETGVYVIFCELTYIAYRV